MSPNDEIINNFSNSPKKQNLFQESVCFLKTNSNRFKEHWAVLNGNEIYCYRNRGDSQHRVMHCLTGTFIKEIADEKCPDTGKPFYPVKIVLPPNKSRILYFDSENLKDRWLNTLYQALGISNLFDFYETGKVLGKGQEPFCLHSFS